MKGRWDGSRGIMSAVRGSEVGRGEEFDSAGSLRRRNEAMRYGSAGGHLGMSRKERSRLLLLRVVSDDVVDNMHQALGTHCQVGLHNERVPAGAVSLKVGSLVAQLRGRGGTTREGLWSRWAASGGCSYGGREAAPGEQGVAAQRMSA